MSTRVHPKAAPGGRLGLIQHLRSNIRMVTQTPAVSYRNRSASLSLPPSHCFLGAHGHFLTHFLKRFISNFVSGKCSYKKAFLFHMRRLWGLFHNELLSSNIQLTSYIILIPKHTWLPWVESMKLILCISKDTASKADQWANDWLLSHPHTFCVGFQGCWPLTSKAVVNKQNTVFKGTAHYTLYHMILPSKFKNKQTKNLEICICRQIPSVIFLAPGSQDIQNIGIINWKISLKTLNSTWDSRPNIKIDPCLDFPCGTAFVKKTSFIW